MKLLLLRITSGLALSASALLLIVLIGCSRPYGSSSRTNEVSEAIYPLGIDLNTLEGNLWVYHDVVQNGKAYGIQVKSVQNSFARFQEPGSLDEYIGLHTFGFEQLGYVDGALVGKTGNVEQVLVPKDAENANMVITAGLFAGKAASLDKTGDNTFLFTVDNKRVYLERGIGIVRVEDTHTPGNSFGSYELESITPDPLAHFAE